MAADSFSSVVNSPVTLKYNDIEFRLSNLTLKDWGEVCEFVAFQPYNRAQRVGVNGEHLLTILRECSNARELSPDSEEVIRFSSTTTGFYKLFELSLKRAGNDKSIIEKLLSSDDEQIYIQVARPLYKLILGFDIDADNKENPPPPNQ